MAANSWVKVEDNEKMIAKKIIDQSVFNYGIHIPKEYREGFLNILSKPINRGESTPINAFVEGRNFTLEVRNIDVEKREDEVIQIRYDSNSEFKNYLRERFKISYGYIIDHKVEGSKKSIILPEEYEEFIEFYSTGKKDELELYFVTKDKKMIKREFFKYIGDENSLAGYVKSYKLILLKILLNLVDNEGKAKVEDVAKGFRKFYLDRKENGLIPDFNVDPRIENVESSSLGQIIAVIKDNPFKAFNSKGYINIVNISGIEYFSIDPTLFKQLNDEDKFGLNDIIDRKISLYFLINSNGVEQMSNEVTLKNLFNNVLSKYYKARTSETFAGNTIGSIIRKEIPDYIYSFDFINKNVYKVNGSCGQGNWATVPWIAIMNKNITESTTSGVYIVYLFSDDTKKVYLTLNQGCTELKNEYGKKKTIEIMEQLAKSIHERIDSMGFKTDNNISLGNELYEKGTIFYKEYEAGQVSENEVLINDLNNMMKIYEQYYNELVYGKENQEVDDEKKNDKEEFIDIAIKDQIENISNYINKNGFTYDTELIKNFYLALKSKPFVILAGISGTGKSKLVKLFAESVGAITDNGRFKLIPVKPDWSDSTDLLAYRDLHGVFHAGILTRVIKEASRNKNKPYFICLDEMNLARVEYYFSDMLSIMETREMLESGEIVTDKILSEEYFGSDEEAREYYKDLYIPENLYIIGTVNMDETTFPFSKKVLDRANTIEFSDVDLDVNFTKKEKVISALVRNKFLKSEFIKLDDCIVYENIVHKVIPILKDINAILKLGNIHFGYRIRDEICYYAIYSESNELMSFETAIDYEILQKILPRIQGSNITLKKILIELFKICINNKINNFNYENVGVNEEMFKYLETNEKVPYKKSAEKIAQMMRRFEEDGFTSYWM